MSTREVRCACGALNDVGFATCIRCGTSLTGGPGALPAQSLSARPHAARTRPDPAQAELHPGRALIIVGGLCSAVFALQLFMALRAGEGIPLLSGGDTLDLLRAGMLHTSWDIASREPFRLLSAVYIHFGLIHFGMNMLGLAGTSRNAERFIGTSRTVLGFVLSGVVGFATNVLSVHLSGGHAYSTGGASGGVFGVMGLVLGALMRRRDPQWKSYAGTTVFYAVLFGFMVNGSNAAVSINNGAHLGGLVAGTVFGLLWGGAGPHETRASRVAATLAMVASVASIVLSLTSPLPGLIAPR